jgi:glycopeptide antibiotics resistance protein
MPNLIAPSPVRADRTRHAAAPMARTTRIRTIVVAAVYALVVAAVTLLPVPEGRWACVVPELDPLSVVTRIVNGGFGDLQQLRNNGALVQFLENVLLFVPLGGLVARSVRLRPVLAGAGAGLLVSRAGETTQATGDWGLVRCAYRVFDVSDLLSNTTGAASGAALLVLGARAVRHRRSSR